MAEPFIGEIRQFAGNFAPQGWALCAGQLLPIDQNDALFALIGTTYGGDGQTTFGLPDLQGRVPVHVGSNINLGQPGGSETVTLTQGELPIHAHTAASSNTGVNDQPAGNVWGKTGSLAAYGAPPSSATLNPASVSATGGSQPHENRVPFVAITYIISLEGIFPSQG
jgi:microcystin-dependent protein